jgi:hypothetical protein
VTDAGPVWRHPLSGDVRVNIPSKGLRACFNPALLTAIPGPG